MYHMGVGQGEIDLLTYVVAEIRHHVNNCFCWIVLQSLSNMLCHRLHDPRFWCQIIPQSLFRICNSRSLQMNWQTIWFKTLAVLGGSNDFAIKGHCLWGRKPLILTKMPMFWVSPLKNQFAFQLHLAFILSNLVFSKITEENPWRVTGLPSEYQKTFPRQSSSWHWTKSGFTKPVQKSEPAKSVTQNYN